jgi:hypothetical protein
MPLTVTDSTAFAAGVGGGINFRAKLSASLYSDYAAIWSQREVATSNDYKGSLIFGTSDNVDGYPEERFSIASTGNVSIANGNVVMATSGTGIDFSATAGTGTSELLNDYEEGTWTGTLTGGTTNPTTAVTATGRYTKIGRVVTVQIYFNNVNTLGASGLLGVTGLPFACNASNGSTGAVSFYNLATFTGSPFVALGVNESFLNCFSNISNSAFGNVTHNAGAASNYLTTSVTYTVA